MANLVIEKKVKGSLVGVNGNAYALMGHFQSLAKKQGWAKEEIEAVINEAKTSDYDHLVTTLEEHMEEYPEV